MAPILVIGYGNTLRGDDGVGPVVAERLREGCDEQRIVIIACHLLTPDLAEPVSRADFVLFIDAAAEGRPGDIVVRPLEADTATSPSLTHHFAPPVLLGLCRAAYGRVPPAAVLTVCGETFDLGEGLSETVSAALPRVISLARDMIARGRP